MEVIETPYEYVITLPVTLEDDSEEVLSFYCYKQKGCVFMDINLSCSNTFIYGVSSSLVNLDKLPTMAIDASEDKEKQILLVPLDEDKAQVVITEGSHEEVLFIHKREMLALDEFFVKVGEFKTESDNFFVYSFKWLFTLPSKLIGWK